MSPDQVTTMATSPAAQDAAPHTTQNLFSYSIDGFHNEHILQRARDFLRPHLPTSLSLYRRLQFGRFFAATRLISSIDLETALSSRNPPDPWLIAFVDRSCRPETELWMFGSWETDSNINTDDPGNTQAVTIDGLVLELARTIRSLHLPASIHHDVLETQARTASSHTPSNQDANHKDAADQPRGDHSGYIHDPQIMLWGAVNEPTMQIVRRLGLLGRDFQARAASNYTFIWNVDDFSQPQDTRSRDLQSLPAGLRWGQLQPTHFDLVRSRTSIPRRDKTLAVLPHLAIFHDENPIAWVFVGLDASLTTLHVEEDFRRRGLAQLLTIKLFTEKMERFWEAGVTRWALGNVGIDNEASASMCRSIGGREGAKAYWLRVHLDLVGTEYAS